jgi:hypothetical protein
MLSPLVISALIATFTVAVHMTGLGILMGVMRSRSRHIRPHENTWRQAAFIILIVLGLFVIHAIEIWAYAGLYMILGAFGSLEPALYFSTSTFTTLGYGDVIIDTKWRLVAAIEGVNGFLLLGWSTAFLVTIIGRLRSVEFDWLDRLGDDD